MQAFYVFGLIALTCMACTFAAICVFVIVHFVLLTIDEIEGALQEWRMFK